ncbi:MAG: hypothetical protein HC836_35580 [Richelia sp. RM2_1_2]|nr:hypothetical protein [Richelia sp. RM2_1_2]
MFQPWPAIASFHKVKTDTLTYEQLSGLRTATVRYNAKIKLHGTNASIIVLPDGRVLPQNRSKIISIYDDNYGFAKWVLSTESYWADLRFMSDEIVVVYGEWCGKGIQSNAAISNIDKQIFVVFAVQYGQCFDQNNSIFVSPNVIKRILSSTYITEEQNVYVLPWYNTQPIKINFWDDKLGLVVNKMNSMVNCIEQIDPWVEENFGIRGIGEGLVFYPSSLAVLNGSIRRQLLSSYIFKVKGQQHQVIKTRQAVMMNPILAKTLDDFVDLVATEARMLQAVSETVGGKFDKKYIGPVVAWINRDVRKDIENGEVILPDGFEWKVVSDRLTQRTKTWYISKIEE